MKKKLPLIITNLLLVAIFLLHVAFSFEFINRLEDLSYDMRLNLTMPNKQDDRVFIVDIDEKSLASVGRWPWSRDKIALMLDNLFDYYKVSLVGFDIVFAERDESSGLKVLEQLSKQNLKNDAMYQKILPRLKTQLDYNNLFAQKIKGRKVVLGYSFSNDSDRVTGKLPSPVFISEALKAGNYFLKNTGYSANLPELQDNAYSAGHFNPDIDQDGVCRRVPILLDYQGSYYDALSVAMVRGFLGDKPLPLKAGFGSGGNKLEWLGIDIFKIPVDEKATALIPYRGREGSFKYVPALDILQKNIKKDELNGGIILVGTRAAGLYDLRSTPVAPVYPGVEIHANMITGILDQNIKQIPDYVGVLECLLLCMIGLIMTFCLPFINPLKSILLISFMLLISIGINTWAWQANMVLPLASSVLMISLLFAVNMSYGFFAETKIKYHLTGLFGQYVPKELVAEMSKNPENFSIEGESRDMTVLFSDVRGFTTISEGLQPRELTKLMNEYMTPMTHVIQKYRGTIDKYIGDAIMAFWGAPLRDDEHARNAILAALDMQATLDRLRPQFIQKGWPEIRIGVGINSGIMRVGNMGSEFRMAYTVIGDTVNLGSRLEGITKQYGVGIIVGETTRNAVSDIVFRELDRVRVKGKDQPVVIYEPVGLETQVDQAAREELKLFNEVLTLYRAMSWDAAERQLLELKKIFPDKYIYKLYLERIHFFRNEPPEADWDGVFKFTTK
jgi:adenylate cyclase